jgi:ABC-2 type transport system ATP-binding protein
MSQSSSAIALHAVRKAFRTVVAVNDVSFEVNRGEIFGLLGPNGAGKTTLLRLIMDIFRPDSGSIEVFGRSFQREDKARIGYLPEDRGLYTRQKVQAVLEYFVQLKGVPHSQARTRTLQWLERLDMLDVKDYKVQELSKGNQQKIQFIATVAAEPEILVLDEPFSGLDPVNARSLIQVIRELAAKGKTIVLSTHQMNLVESLCRRVFMIHHGRQVLYGDLEQIRKAHSENAVVVRSNANYDNCPWVVHTTANGRGTLLVLRENCRPRDVLAWLLETGADVESFECEKTPLEDIFIMLVQGNSEERSVIA